MARNLKVLGLAIAAVMAMGALSASAASAANFTAAEYPVTIHAEGGGSETFHTLAGDVVCNTSTFSGSATGASETLTVHPEYSDCKVFGILNSTVDTTGCNYIFHTGSGSGDNWTATVSVSCGSGSSIKVTAATCAAEIKSTGQLSSVDLINNTGAGDVEVNPTVGGIPYTVTKDGLGCGFGKVGEERSDGTYTATKNITVTGTSAIDVG